MKKLLIAAMTLLSMTAMAGETTLLDTKVLAYDPFEVVVNNKFVMDQNSGEGFVLVTVTENFNQYRYPAPGTQNRYSYPRTILAEKIKVQGLHLMGDQVVYQGDSGNVVCGTMGESRVLKVPTLYLNGNCKLTSKVSRSGFETRVVVILKTK